MEREYIPEWMRRAVFQRDRYTCRYCGGKKAPFHLDHVYPVAKGGETTVENLVTACDDCNLQKGARVGIWPKPLDYFERPRDTGFYIGRAVRVLVLGTAVLLFLAVLAGVSEYMFRELILSPAGEADLSGVVILGSLAGTVVLAVWVQRKTWRRRG